MLQIFKKIAPNSTTNLFGNVSLRVKIFVAMGLLCVLITLIAGLAITIINENIQVSKKLAERGQALSQRVEGVSASIKGSLGEQQDRQLKFSQERDALGQERRLKQVALYQLLLSVESAMAAVDRNSTKIIINSDPFSVVAKEVETLKTVTDQFFAQPDLPTLDEKKVKGASRGLRAYLGTYDEVKALDAENVSMTQQIDKVKRAQEMGATVRERMAALVADLKAQTEDQIKAENEAAKTALDQALAKDGETMNSILANQTAIRQNVADDVKANSALEGFLLNKRHTLVLMAVVALALGIGFSLVIVRMITRPIIRAVQIAKGIAEGDLEQVVDIRGGDEIGQLGQSMATMIDNLRANRDEIAENVRVLDDVAGTVSSSLEEVSASMNEINGTTRLNVQKAQMTNEMSATAKTNTEEGKARMHEMVSTITEVRAASQEIGKTIKVINDIAFQTNLLALNAAVEAAHAGEQGKGFAVVAEEVRRLAQRCAEAANDTTRLLEGPLKKIGVAVEVAGKTSTALDTIYDNVNAMSSLIEDIAIGSEMQAAGIKHISVGLTQIDSAAQNLAAQTDHLSASMDRYKKRAADAEEQLQIASL